VQRSIEQEKATMPQSPQPHRSQRWTRRLHFRIGLAAVLVSFLVPLPGTALAQAGYPNRPIKIVVGFPAGGAADLTARVVGAKMGESLSQHVVIENRAGAAGTIATGVVARAEPDGYTLLLAVIANAANETLQKNLPYKFGEHLVAVAPLNETSTVLVVHPSLGVRSVAELIALAKANPGQIQYGSGGRGSSAHLAGELFNSIAGTQLIPVQYKGAPDITKDLLTGEIKVTFSPIAPLLEFIKSGRLRGLATTGPKRTASLPNLPTLAEVGLTDYDMRLWSGLLAPAGTPREIIARLSAAATTAVGLPDVKAAFAAQGLTPLVGTPEQFDAFYRKEVARWRKLAEEGRLGQ
jgi:tripartite-type tricarboxylate transporter receptor subunit TctC